MSTHATPLSSFDRPSVTVDLVLMSVEDRALKVMLQVRPEHPAKGEAALPGGFVHVEDSLEATVARVLTDKARLPGAFVEQLYTFGAPDRDPRGRVISVAYYALVPAERLHAALRAAADLMLARVETSWAGLADGQANVRTEGGEQLPLAFDHAMILATAVERLRGKLDYSDVGLELLPQSFPLRRLQEIHEAILGRPLTKPAFRRKVLDRGTIEPTGLREAAGAFRPAELYRRKSNPSDTRGNEHG
jgi:8-oxo-dGTP diphosphatase